MSFLFTEQGSGRSHVGRINIGHGHHAVPKQGRYLIGVYFVVLGFAAMDGFHIENMAKDEGNIFFTAEIGEPVPSKDAAVNNKYVMIHQKKCSAYKQQEGQIYNVDELFELIRLTPSSCLPHTWY